MFAMAHAPPSLSEPPSYSLEPLDIVHATTCRSHKHEDRSSHAESGENSYFLVADGHGGAEVAERASSSLLDQIVSRSTDQPLEAAMREAFLSLHKEVPTSPCGVMSTARPVRRRTHVPPPAPPRARSRVAGSSAAQICGHDRDGCRDQSA